MKSPSSKPQNKDKKMRCQVVAEKKPKQQLVVKRKATNLAPKRRYRPHILRPSAIRRICQLPAEKCNANTEAKVMYLNSNFGKCSEAVCHEDICHDTETCKKHKSKGQPKTSITMRKLKDRMVRRSTKRSSMPSKKKREA